jgi:hypothetical protein
VAEIWPTTPGCHDLDGRTVTGDRSRGRATTRVLLCDACCCGTERKHPGVDHAAIRERLGSAAELAGGRSRRVDCLGVCERSNVVVVKSRSSGTFWVGEVLDEPVVAALESWIGRGAPLPLPANVLSHVFDRRSMTEEPDSAPVVEFVSLLPRGER